METERARQRTEEAADAQKLRLQIDALKRDLESARDDLLSIRAPYHAFVISLAQRNAGNVVQAGVELCQLARIDATPYARLLVREPGLARLAAGQRVRLFFDALSLPALRNGDGAARMDQPGGSRFPGRPPVHRFSLPGSDILPFKRRAAAVAGRDAR